MNFKKGGQQSVKLQNNCNMKSKGGVGKTITTVNLGVGLALRLCNIAEAMKPGRKKKIPFELVEIIPYLIVEYFCWERLL